MSKVKVEESQLGEFSDRELLEELARRLNAGPAVSGTSRRPTRLSGQAKPEKKRSKVEWAQGNLDQARAALAAAQGQHVEAKDLRKKQDSERAHQAEIQKWERILASVKAKAQQDES